MNSNIGRIAVLLFAICIIISCGAPKLVSNSDVEVGIKFKPITDNPHNPYYFKNGYRDFNIEQVLSIQEGDSIYINELRFNAVYTAFYIKKVMFDTFGKWDKAIWNEGEYHPILIWENKKLLESEDELFSLAANGDESYKITYTSVIVFDSKNKDCLSENSEFKESLINYFANKIRRNSSKRKFYDVYWKMVKSHKI